MTSMNRNVQHLTQPVRRHYYSVYSVTSPVLFSVLCTDCNATLRHKHRVHRVVTSAFWRTISHEGKIRLGWWGWGVHAHPLLLYLTSPVLSNWVGRYTDPVSSLVKIWTLWSQVRVYRIQYTFKQINITFPNLLLQLWKDWEVGAQWKYDINVNTWT